MLEINKIYNMDCLEGLKDINDESIDCVWTDPPYNIGYEYDEYKDDKELEQYLNWCDIWLRECWRVLKPEGGIFVKMLAKHVFKFYDLLKNNGFCFKNLIIWKRNSQANYQDRYLGGYEIIYFCTKFPHGNFYPEGFLRNTENTVRFGDGETKGKLYDLWDDVKPVTGGYVKHPEAIYIPGTDKKEHPAQHPEELVLRCIKCTTKEGDLVLDPFMGSGTVAAACKKSGRSFIGFEISARYFEISNKRLNQSSLSNFDGKGGLFNNRYVK